VPIVLKYGSLNPLEPSGLVKGCNGIALHLIKKYSHKRTTITYIVDKMTKHGQRRTLWSLYSIRSCIKYHDVFVNPEEHSNVLNRKCHYLLQNTSTKKLYQVLNYLKFEIFGLWGCYTAYKSTQCNIPEGRRYHFQRDGRLKSCTSEVNFLSLLLLIGSVSERSQVTNAAE
jgi:hypothetical protein